MNWQKSDEIVYTAISDLHWKFKRESDQQFINQMTQNIPRCPIDYHELNGSIIDPKIVICDDMISKRGSMCPEPVHSCPNKIYDPYLVQEYMLLPCPKPGYDNSLVSDHNKICSKKHQLFRNQSRRK